MGESTSEIQLLQQPQTSFTGATIKNCTGGPVGVRDDGFPGYLTDKQYEIFESFRDEVSKRDEAFRHTIYSFGYEEDEAYALCRWLRARKYEMAAVLKMVEGATDMRREPSKNGFYPDPKTALNVEPSIYISQYPQLYCGNSKDGFPLFISKPGVLNISGIECITTIAGILRYHWYAMIHDFAARLREQKAKDPNFHRFEVVCIVDLENLAVSNVGKRPMNIIKAQSEVDSLCFPETLSRFIIVNAPGAFSMIWNVIKGWIDARTAAKVEIHSYRKKWEPRLLELVDRSELPSDYGGKAIPTNQRLEVENKEVDVVRQYAQTLTVCKYTNTETYDLKAQEELEIFVLTRSMREGKFTFLPQDGKSVAMPPVIVKHLGKGTDEEDPTRTTFPTVLKGPRKFQFKVECSTGSWSYENFVIGAKVRDPASKAKGKTPAVSKVKTPSKVTSVALPSNGVKKTRAPKKTVTPSPTRTSPLRGNPQVIQTPARRVCDEITDAFENDFVVSAAVSPPGGSAKIVASHSEDARAREQMVLALIQKQREEMGKKKLRQRCTSSTTSLSSNDSTPSFAMVDPQDESARATGWSCGGATSLDGVLGLWKGPN